MTQQDPVGPLNQWIKDVYFYQGKHERTEWEPPQRGNKYKKELIIIEEYNNGHEKYSRWVSRLDDSEDRSVSWNTKWWKSPSLSIKKKKISQKTEDSIRHLVDNIKHINIHIIGIQGEEREKDEISLKETMAKNFPLLLKETHPGPRSTESPTQGKWKEKYAKAYINQTKRNLTKRENIKSRKGKATNNKGIPIRLTADLSEEMLQARRVWHDTGKVMKGKNLPARLLQPAMISLRFKELSTFTNKKKLRNSAPPKWLYNKY